MPIDFLPFGKQLSCSSCLVYPNHRPLQLPTKKAVDQHVAFLTGHLCANLRCIWVPKLTISLLLSHFIVKGE